MIRFIFQFAVRDEFMYQQLLIRVEPATARLPVSPTTEQKEKN
jgi:hypothetical protein